MWQRWDSTEDIRRRFRVSRVDSTGEETLAAVVVVVEADEVSDADAPLRIPPTTVLAALPPEYGMSFSSLTIHTETKLIVQE